MSIRRRVLAAVALPTLGLSAALGVAAVFTATSASAAEAPGPTLGTLSFSPATGKADTNFTMVSSAACPVGATNLVAFINNPAAGYTDVVLLSNTTNGISTTGPMSVGVSNNLYNTAIANSLPLPSGSYSVFLRCQSRLGTPAGSFTGVITVTAIGAAGTANIGSSYSSGAAVVPPPPTPTPTPTVVPTVTPTVTPTVPPTSTTTTTTTTSTTSRPTTSSSTTSRPTTSSSTTSRPTTSSSTTTSSSSTSSTTTSETIPSDSSSTTSDVVAGVNGSSGDLPRTGAETLPLVGLGFGLVLLGSGAVVAARRRRALGDHR